MGNCYQSSLGIGIPAVVLGAGCSVGIGAPRRSRDGRDEREQRERSAEPFRDSDRRGSANSQAESRCVSGRWENAFVRNRPKCDFCENFQEKTLR